jgi:predicted oxidoreductase
MVDGSFDYMQLNNSPNVLESVRICFQKGYSANHRLQQILATLVSKYHVGADTILLSWVLKHPK